MARVSSLSSLLHLANMWGGNGTETLTQLECGQPLVGYPWKCRCCHLLGSRLSVVWSAQHLQWKWVHAGLWWCEQLMTSN